MNSVCGIFKISHIAPTTFHSQFDVLWIQTVSPIIIIIFPETSCIRHRIIIPLSAERTASMKAEERREKNYEMNFQRKCWALRCSNCIGIRNENKSAWFCIKCKLELTSFPQQNDSNIDLTALCSQMNVVVAQLERSLDSCVCKCVCVCTRWNTKRDLVRM